MVAEFVAGTGGRSSGLAYEILDAGFTLDIPRMFAALFLITLTGVAIVRRHGCPVQARAVELARKRNRSGNVTALLIENATGIFTGRAGAAMRTGGSIRIRDGVIVGHRRAQGRTG